MVDLDSLKKIVKKTVDEKRPVIEDIARYLYENPELGSEEFKAFEKITKVLVEHGFNVEKGVYGMPTVFVASFKGKRMDRRSLCSLSTTRYPVWGTAAGMTS